MLKYKYLFLFFVSVVSGMFGNCAAAQEIISGDVGLVLDNLVDNIEQFASDTKNENVQLSEPVISNHHQKNIMPKKNKQYFFSGVIRHRYSWYELGRLQLSRPGIAEFKK